MEKTFDQETAISDDSFTNDEELGQYCFKMPKGCMVTNKPKENLEQYCLALTGSQQSIADEAKANTIIYLKMIIEAMKQRSCFIGNYAEVNNERISILLDAFANKPLSFKFFDLQSCPEDIQNKFEGTLAFVNKQLEIHTINLGKEFFDEQTSPLLTSDCRPGILIHEMSHFANVLNLKDLCLKSFRNHLKSLQKYNKGCYKYFSKKRGENCRYTQNALFGYQGIKKLIDIVENENEEEFNPYTDLRSYICLKEDKNDHTFKNYIQELYYQNANNFQFELEDRFMHSGDYLANNKWDCCQNEDKYSVCKFKNVYHRASEKEKIWSFIDAYNIDKDGSLCKDAEGIAFYEKYINLQSTGINYCINIVCDCGHCDPKIELPGWYSYPQIDRSDKKITQDQWGKRFISTSNREIQLYKLCLDSNKVQFNKIRIVGKNSYKIYYGYDRLSALEFLTTQQVTQKYVYIIVETIQGDFGKDMNGYFDEGTGADIDLNQEFQELGEKLMFTDKFNKATHYIKLAQKVANEFL